MPNEKTKYICKLTHNVHPELGLHVLFLVQMSLSSFLPGIHSSLKIMKIKIFSSIVKSNASLYPDTVLWVKADLESRAL